MADEPEFVFGEKKKPKKNKDKKDKKEVEEKQEEGEEVDEAEFKAIAPASKNKKDLGRIGVLAFESPFVKAIESASSRAYLLRRLYPCAMEATGVFAPLARHPPANDAVVSHGERLPEAYVARIQQHDAQILKFLRVFLNDVGLAEAQLFVNGGYVRDLLLEKEPDDLDLSICLCEFEETIKALMGTLPRYLSDSGDPDLGIMEIEIVDNLSDESKSKQLDTFTAKFTIADREKPVRVDVMPTIGEEIYEADSHIPIRRGVRGTPKQDALRRDLTIGAMLLDVKVGDDGGLEYRFLDFYGGFPDLCSGILRAPSPGPDDKTLEDVQQIVLTTNKNKDLAERLGLTEGAMKSREAEALQVLWWAKILIDDPLRMCRALRFAAKLRGRGFKLHEFFWLAAPFAMESLRSKIAGERKNTEYLKIGGCGFEACSHFFQLIFAGSPFGPEGPEGEPMFRLAEAFIGGCNDKGEFHTISRVKDFDADAFRTLASPLASVTDENELYGCLMSCAILASKLKGADELGVEFKNACDGLCVSRSTRDGGRLCLQVSKDLAEEPPIPGQLEAGFAEACGIDKKSFGSITYVWESLEKLRPSGFKDEVPPRCRRKELMLEMLAMRAPDRAQEVRDCLGVLYRYLPPLRGNALGVPKAAQRHIGKVKSCLNVALRYLRYEASVEDSSQLGNLFKAHPKIKAALSDDVWSEEGPSSKKAQQPGKRQKNKK